MKKEIKKNKKGITLIALIITIIIMLILVGVTVQMAIESNLIGTAEITTEKQGQAKDHENIKFAIMTYDIKKYEDDKITLVDVMKQEGWCSDAVYNEVWKTIKVTTVEGNEYTVKEDRTIVNGWYDCIVYNHTELKNAIINSTDGDIIGIVGDISISGSLGNGTAKQIYLAGVNSSSSLNVESASSNNVEFIIEDLIIKSSGTSYKGFASTYPVKYLNCTFEKQYWTEVKQIEFENCIFNQTSADAYNIWTYSAINATFTNCTFNSNGKSVLIYNEGLGVDKAVVNLNNCIFKAENPVDGKAAIEIDSTYQGFEVNINNCTSIGFGKGSVSRNELWNHKKGTNATITVDGEEV